MQVTKQIEMAESSSFVEDGDGDAIFVSIPRGGPIYVPDMVGPLTRVPEFEHSVFHQLQDLKKELSGASIDICDDDISVDELKIITEEELVNKAFEEAFQDGAVTGISSQIPEKPQDASSREERDALVSNEPSNNSAVIVSHNGELGENISKKRKRRRCGNQRSHPLKEPYIAKVEQLARIKQKQDEEKAAVRLHSFNGGCRTNKSAPVSSEKIERLTSLKSMSSTTKVRSSNTHEHVSVPYPEVLLYVEVYHNSRPWLKTQEFLVLGCQLLTELRDKIYCLTDQVMEKAGQHDPSGYFLIEDVFYNDLREPSAIDYGQPILDWLENCKDEALEKWKCIISGDLSQKQKELLGNATEPQLPRFKATEMHRKRFSDLRFRLGGGYLYCHQGDCKHVMVIRDMRLIHPEDVQNRAAYPLVTFQTRLRFRKCCVCKIYKAEKMTVDDKWAPENPCYFCGLCYYMLHYMNNGSLLYNDFSVYDYYHE